MKVLIVDDSASVRQALRQALETDPAIQVIGVASDPYAAVERIRHEVPDVITLDLEMPRMDGLTFLGKIMSQRPIPVVVCSSFTEASSDLALTALERGAVEVIAKPQLAGGEVPLESRARVCDAVRAAARARLSPAPQRLPVAPKLSADAVLPRTTAPARVQTTDKIVAVGASTGGTEALRELLEAMPADAPGMVVVQHMPELFTQRFARRLDATCPMAVKEAANGDRVVRGQVLLAPGNRHLLLKRADSTYFVELRDGPLVNRHRPSVDVLFRSAARYGGKNVIGVILTGMGDDGASGMLEMKEAGGFNIAQDEASCVVFGMPAEAIKRGAVHRVLPLGRIAGEILHAAD